MTKTANSQVPIGKNVLPIDTWSPRDSGAPSEFEYIDIASIDRSQKAIVATTRTSSTEAPSRARQIVKSGDVLVSTVRPNLNAVAMVPPHLEDAIASTGYTVLRSHPKKLDSRYLYHWVQTPAFIGAMVSQSTGASYPAVSDRIVKANEIPLLPLSEQRRIADILDKADAIRGKRREAVAASNELPYAIYSELFGDPVTNEKSWPTSPVGKLLDTIIDYRGKTPPKSASGIPLISAANIKRGSVVLDRPSYISEIDYKAWTTRGFTQPGDVLITTEAPVGEVALYPSEGTYLISRRVMALRPRAGKLWSRFLLHTFLHPHVRMRIHSKHHGSTVPRILKPDVTGFEIPVPPPELQHHFEEAIAAVDATTTLRREASRKDQSLFASLTQRAFHGEL